MPAVLAPSLVFLAAVGFYALTWAGCYFHDGALFADLIESGAATWCHLAYLPVGRLVQGVLTPLGWPGGETALAVLSVLSGAGCAAFTFAIARRLVDDGGRALLAALVVALAPAPWFGSNHVEIHIFSGLGGCFGAWLAVLVPALVPAVALATSVAVATHLSAACLMPGFVGLALLARVRRGQPTAPRHALAGLVAGTLTVLVWLLVSRQITGAGDRPGGDATIQLGIGVFLGGFLRWPHLLASFPAEGLQPWGLVLVAALLAPLLARRGERRLALSVPLGLAGLLVFVLTAPPLEGQWLLPALPFLALGVALVLPDTLRGWRGVGLLACLLVQLTWSVQYRLRLGRDVNRDWAEAAARVVAKPAVLVCGGPPRRRWAERLTGQPAFDVVHVLGAPAEQAVSWVLERAASVRAEGRRVYLDREVLLPAADLPQLARFATELRARAGIGPRAVVGAVYELQ